MSGSMVAAGFSAGDSGASCGPQTKILGLSRGFIRLLRSVDAGMVSDKKTPRNVSTGRRQLDAEPPL